MNSQSQTVFVVDDIPAFRAIIRDMLEEMGFTEIEEAADGNEAARKISEMGAALVISDYMMTPGSGLDLLGALKSDPSLSHIPFIMVSAVGEKAIIDKANALGAKSYLTKPVSFPDLRKKVLEAISSQMSE